MKRPWRGLLPLLLVAASLAACSKQTRETYPDKIYRAYGKVWRYSKTEIRTTPFWPHGPFGKNGHRELHVISAPSGERISIPDRLYALQKDGRYRKIKCCEYFREAADLYNFDGQLVLVFDNAREFITDCFIYPGGYPDNELRPKEQRIYGSTVYAIFDPAAKIFRVDTFDAGDYSDEEFRAQGSMSIEEDTRFRFEKRKPFLCNDPRARNFSTNL